MGTSAFLVVGGGSERERVVASALGSSARCAYLHCRPLGQPPGRSCYWHEAKRCGTVVVFCVVSDEVVLDCLRFAVALRGRSGCGCLVTEYLVRVGLSEFSGAQGVVRLGLVRVVQTQIH